MFNIWLDYPPAVYDYLLPRHLPMITKETGCLLQQSLADVPFLSFSDFFYVMPSKTAPVSAL